MKRFFPLICVILSISGLSADTIVESMLVGENEVMARKLMDGMLRSQEACASNIANMDVEGYHRVSVNKNFDAQLRERMRDGDMEGMEELEPVMERAREAGGISLEQELMMSNKMSSQYQALAMTYAHSMDKVKLVVSDN